MTDLYATLDVDRAASPSDVRKAYRRAAKKAHPDCGGSCEAFAKLSTALEVLTDPARRRRYDETGEITEKPVDNAMAETMNTVAASFGRVMAQMRNGMAGNFIHCMKNDLGIYRSQCAQGKAQAEREIAQQEKFAKRFRKKGDGPNWLADMARAAVEPHRQQAAKCAHEIETADRAILFLDDYDDAEAGEQARMMAQFGTHGRMW